MTDVSLSPVAVPASGQTVLQCCLWQMLTFPGAGTSIPGPDSLGRVQYVRP